MGIVLTADKGFTQLTATQLDTLPYDVYHPDDFFILIDDSSPDTVRATTRDQLAYWCKRSPEGFNLVTALENSDCPQFAARIQQHLQDGSANGRKGAC